MLVGQQIQGFSRSPGMYGQRWRAAKGTNTYSKQMLKAMGCAPIVIRVDS